MRVQSLFDLFAEYEPTAVGISSEKKYGWVCLPDLETLQDFIECVNGKKAGDGHVWTVISDYDPTVVPARDWEELRSNQKLELQAEADEKRAQRRLKRETRSDVMGFENFEGFNGGMDDQQGE